jgi:hypothetical protein
VWEHIHIRETYQKGTSKSTDKERVDANEAQCERDSSKSNIDAIVKMNKNNGEIQSLAMVMAMSREKKVDKKKFGKATEENNAEY